MSETAAIKQSICCLPLPAMHSHTPWYSPYLFVISSPLVLLLCCSHAASLFPPIELYNPNLTPSKNDTLPLLFSSFPFFLPGALAFCPPQKMPCYPINLHFFSKALISFLLIHHPLVSTESLLYCLAKFQKFTAALLASITSSFLC